MPPTLQHWCAGLVLLALSLMSRSLLPPGLPAVSVLIASSLLGVTAGRAAFGDADVHSQSAARTAGFRAACASAAALPFLLWAWCKVASGDDDLGALTFAFFIAATGSAACTIHRFGCRARSNEATILLMHAGAVALATCLLSLNFAYVLVAIPGLPLTFYAYLLLGAAFWAAAGGWVAQGLMRYRVKLGEFGAEGEGEFGALRSDGDV